MKTVVTAITASVVTGTLIMGVRGNAEDKTAPLIVPYHGHMDKDGKAVNGTVKLHFYLYDQAEGGDPIWDDILTVQVYNGEFTALLGAGKPITDVLNWAKDVYLGVAVVTGSGEVALSNRQRFLPVPYAGGVAPGANVVLGGFLQVNGSDLRLGINDGRASCKDDATGKVCRALVHYETTDKDDKKLAQLVINFDNDFPGGVKIEGPENDGTLAALTISANGQTMKLDGNEIDSSDAILLSKNTQKGVKVYGDLQVSGDLNVNGKRPFVFARYNMPASLANNDLKTDYKTSDWFCVIGGMYFHNGDINEVGAKNWYMFTYRNGDGHWHIQADMPSHKNHHESHEMGIMCVRKGMYSVGPGNWFREEW